MIIEDSKTTRFGIAKLLENKAGEIIEAINGVDGIRKALRHYPDVITMDVEMPHLNGIGTTRILDLLGLNIPIIFTSNMEKAADYVDKYENVLGFCNKSEINEKLPTLVDKAFALKRNFTDIGYPMRQREMLDLMGTNNRKRLLVVEDSKMMLTVLLKVLDQTGLYELYHAKDGLEGLFKAVLLRPDLILSDIVMPKVDGFLLAQLLYMIGHPFPIAFASAKSDVNTVKKAINLEGVRGFLVKEEIATNSALLRQKIESMLDITPEQKLALQETYSEINVEKLMEVGDKQGCFVFSRQVCNFLIPPLN